MTGILPPSSAPPSPLDAASLAGLPPPPGLPAASILTGVASVGGPALGASFAAVLRGARAGSHATAAAAGSPVDADAEVDDADADDDPSLSLDPAARHAAHLGPPAHRQTSAEPLAMGHLAHSHGQPPTHATAGLGEASSSGATAAAPPPVEARAAASLEELLPTFVRQVGWGTEGDQGAIHLELGAGALSGARLVVQANAGRVHVTLSAPAGVHASVDLAAWRDRIAARLAARGLDVGAVDVA
jgi:hypothetical protein